MYLLVCMYIGMHSRLYIRMDKKVKICVEYNLKVINVFKICIEIIVNMSLMNLMQLI